MPLYLGVDSSTQGLTAIVIDADADRRAIVYESGLKFDEALPRYGTRHGALPRTDPAVAVSPNLTTALLHEQFRLGDLSDPSQPSLAGVVITTRLL